MGSNPNGLWTYLYDPKATSDPELIFVVPGSNCSWTEGLGPFNAYPDVQRCPVQQFSIGPDEVTITPGPAGTVAILRWTAPTTSDWTIDLSHRWVWPSALVDGGLTLKVDNATVHTSFLKPSNFAPEVWSSTMRPSVGAVVEFSIDVGVNGVQDWDRVAVTLTFSGGTVLGDVNQDCVVNGADLGALLGAWGPCVDCPADLNGDGVVSGADLGILPGAWTG